MLLSLSRRTVRWLGWLGVVLALVVGPWALVRPAAAQNQSDLRVTARFGFDGHYRDQAWTPLFVSLTNSGPDRKLQIRVSTSTYMSTNLLFVRDVELAAGTTRDLTLDIVLEGYSSGIEVEIYENGRRVADATATANSVALTDLVYGVVAGDPDSFSALGQIDPLSGSGYVALIPLADLPVTSAAYSTLDVLILSDVDTGTLTAAQLSAIEAWVSAGGRLWVTGGPGWQKTAAGLGALLPLAPTGTQSVDDTTVLASFASRTDAPGAGLLVATGPLNEGAIVRVASGGTPLLVERVMGVGKVEYLAFDPGTAPLAEWTGTASIFRKMLSLAQDRPTWASGFSTNVSSAVESAGYLPDLQLASPFLVCGMLAAYVAIIGPLNYVFLRVIKRRQLAWVTIPATVVLFSCATYLVGFTMAGRRAIVHEVSLVQGFAGGTTGRVDMAVGLYSPSRRDYDMILPEGVLARPAVGYGGTAQDSSIDGLHVEVGDRYHIRSLRTDVAAVSTLVAQGSAALPAVSVALTSEPSGTGSLLKGEIVNNSSETLRDVVVLVPGASQRIGDIAPGARGTVNVFVSGGRAPQAPLNSVAPPGVQITGAATSGYVASGDTTIDDILGTTPYSYTYYNDIKTARRYALLSAAMSNYSGSRGSGIYLAAWSDKAPFEVGVEDAPYDTRAETLYLLRLPAALEPTQDGGVITLTPDFMMWQALEQQSTSGSYGPYDVYLYDTDQLAFLFRPAQPVAYSNVKQVVVHLDEASGLNGLANVRVDIWNYTRSDWDEVKDIAWGDTIMPNPADYVGPGGEVQLRLSGQPGGYASVSRIDATVVLTK